MPLGGGGSSALHVRLTPCRPPCMAVGYVRACPDARGRTTSTSPPPTGRWSQHPAHSIPVARRALTYAASWPEYPTASSAHSERGRGEDLWSMTIQPAAVSARRTIHPRRSWPLSWRVSTGYSTSKRRGLKRASSTARRRLAHAILRTLPHALPSCMPVTGVHSLYPDSLSRCLSRCVVCATMALSAVSAPQSGIAPDCPVSPSNPNHDATGASHTMILPAPDSSSSSLDHHGGPTRARTSAPAPSGARGPSMVSPSSRSIAASSRSICIAR